MPLSDCGIANVNIGTSGAEIGLERLKGLHAPRHKHRELLQSPAAGARRALRNLGPAYDKIGHPAARHG